MRTLLKTILISSFVLFPIACGKSDVEKSKEFIDTGLFPQAIVLLTKQIAKNPEDAEAQFLLGVAFINSGQLQEGDQQFAKAVNLESDYGLRIGREYKKAGDVALKEGNTVEAISLFEVAVRHQPDLKKKVARSVSEKGNDLSRAGKDAQAIELHRYAIDHDPLLGKEIGNWYAVKAKNVESASEERINLLLAAAQFETSYKQETARIRQAAAKEEAVKSAMSVRARMKHVIEQRLDERAWQRLATKSLKTLGSEETVRWSVKYYKKAGYDVKQLTLNDKEWMKIGKVANQSNMFFLSANDFWYLKSSSKSPQIIRAAITKAKGIQFYGDEYMDISIKTEMPPNDVFYWISPKP